MKTLKTIAILLIMSSQAYAVDFNSIIAENSKAQNQLHNQIKETVYNSRIAAQKTQLTGQNQFIADTGGSEIIHVKTKKDLLTFNKEKKHSTASRLQNDKRLAQEFKDLE